MPAGASKEGQERGLEALSSRQTRRDPAFPNLCLLKCQKGPDHAPPTHPLHRGVLGKVNENSKCTCVSLSAKREVTGEWLAAGGREA